MSDTTTLISRSVPCSSSRVLIASLALRAVWHSIPRLRRVCTDCCSATWLSSTTRMLVAASTAASSALSSEVTTSWGGGAMPWMTFSISSTCTRVLSTRVTPVMNDLLPEP
ncbi:hypothetical protein D9M71_781850 [compost metagenome]